MAVFNKTNINFTKELLIDKTSKTIGGIALYYQNNQSTAVSIQVSTSTITFTISSSVNTVTYTGKSINEVVLEINKLNIPIKAKALIESGVLASGDLITVPSKLIPSGFIETDRGQDNSVILRTKSVQVRHKSELEIKLLSPYQSSSLNPWYARIAVGSFTIKKNSNIYYFSIPEYESQTWSSKYGRPIKDVQGETPLIISNNVIKVSRTPIFWNNDNLILTSNDSPLNNNIIDIDVSNGLIYLEKSVPNSAELSVSYSYKEETYEYRGININAHFSQNPSVLGKYILIYLVAYDGTDLQPRKQTVSHVVGNSIEEAINSIPIDNTIPYFIVGAYSVQQIANSNKLKILDTRVLGGGLIDANGPKNPIRYSESLFKNTKDFEAVEKQFLESSNFWDIGRWDGEIYPGSASVIFDIPNEIRDKLPDETIKSKASKFLAGGVKPLYDFSDRPLPDTSNYSSNVSSFLTGASGEYWAPTKYNFPNNIFEFETDVVKDVPLSYAGNLFPASNTGVYQYYIKSDPITAIEWEERVLTTTQGSEKSNRTYSEWEKKRIYDVRDNPIPKGLFKGAVVFNPSPQTKEYRNVNVYSPYHKSWTGLLFDAYFSELYQTITGYKYLNNKINYEVLDTDFNTRDTSTYIGTHPAFSYVFDLMLSSKSGTYQSTYQKAVDDLTEAYQLETAEKLFLKSYFPSKQDFDVFEFDQTGLDLNTLFNALGKIIYRERMYGDVTSVSNLNTALTGILNYINHNYTGYDIDSAFSFFGFSTGAGYYPEVLSLGPDLGYSTNEISDRLNPDYLVLSGPKALSLAVLGLPDTTGQFAQSLETIYTTNKTIIETEVAELLSDFSVLTLDGISIPSSWYTKYNRLGHYVGNVLYDLIQIYESIRDAQKLNNRFISNVEVDGLDASSLHTYFTSIETVLNFHYETVFELLSKGAILDEDFDVLIFCYGWYNKNYTNHYRVCPQIPINDHREKFSNIYNNGTDILLKSIITSEGLAIKSKYYIDNAPGNFALSVPISMFNTLRIGLDEKSIQAKLAGLYNTISGQYITNGVCMIDPRKVYNYAGAEVEMSKEIAKIYKDLNKINDTYNYWDYISSDLSNLRALEFYPDITGVNNSLTFWSKYNSGQVASQISHIRNLGCNAIKVPLDFYFYSMSGQMFMNNLSHLADQCSINKIHLIPRLWTNKGINLSDYSTYTSTQSGQIKSPGDAQLIPNLLFELGYQSEEQYYTDVTSTLEQSPSVLFYEFIDDFNHTQDVSVQFITGGVQQVQDLTSVPIAIAVKDLNQYNNLYSSTVDYIGIPYSGIFKKTLETNINIISSYSDKPIYVSDFSQNMYHNTIDNISTMSEFGIGGLYGFVYDSLTGTRLPGQSGRSFAYSNNTIKTSEYVSALQQLAVSQESLYTYSGLQENTDTSYIKYTNGFKEFLSRNYIFSALKDWRQRQTIYPLHSGDLNLNEFVLQTNILTTVQDSLDYLNTKTGINFTTSQSNILSYFKTNFNSNFLIGQTAWMSGSNYDWKRYGDFYTNWGVSLWSIIFNNNLQR